MKNVTGILKYCRDNQVSLSEIREAMLIKNAADRAVNMQPTPALPFGDTSVNIRLTYNWRTVSDIKKRMSNE